MCSTEETVQEEISKWACPVCKGYLAHAHRDLCSRLCRSRDLAALGHIELEGPGWLCVAGALDGMSMALESGNASAWGA